MTVCQEECVREFSCTPGWQAVFAYASGLCIWRFACVIRCFAPCFFQLTNNPGMLCMRGDSGQSPCRLP